MPRAGDPSFPSYIRFHHQGGHLPGDDLCRGLFRQPCLGGQGQGQGPWRGRAYPSLDIPHCAQGLLGLLTELKVFGLGVERRAIAVQLG